MPAKDVSAEFSFAAIPACLSGWLVPGLGHFMIGKRNRGIIFFAVVVAMFALGIQLEGELFELDTGEKLTLLAGLAEMGVGLPYFITKMMKLGAGTVTSVTYEYGYTFCIVAGLLNMLIVLDVYDIMVGRKD